MNRLNSHKLKGAALVTALLIVLILSILAITTSQLTVTQTQISHHHHHAAESAQYSSSHLNYAENWLNQQLNRPTPQTCNPGNCENNIWPANTWSNLELQTSSWWTNYATIPEYTPNNQSTPDHLITTSSGTIIQETGFIPDALEPEDYAQGQGVYFYEITSRGVAQDQRTNTLTQSRYSKRYQ